MLLCIAILDPGLHDTSGFDVLREIRTFSDVPVLILTVRAEETDVVKGLEWGVGDYMVKPFRQLELLWQKLEVDPGQPELILTRAGIGYLLAKPDWSSSVSCPLLILTTKSSTKQEVLIHQNTTLTSCTQLSVFIKL